MRSISYRFHILAALVAGALVGHTAQAGDVAALTTFTNGTPTNADAVNGNFTAIKDAVNANNARLGAVETTVAGMPAGPVGPAGPQGPVGPQAAQFNVSFDFEEATGSLTSGDASGNGNSLTINTVGSAISALGHSRNGLLLDGISGYAFNAAPKIDLREAVTASAWVFRTAAGGAAQAVVAREGQFTLGINNGNLQFAVQTQNGPVWSYIGTGSVPLTTWTHVMASYDGIGIRTFVNGMLTSYTPYANGIITAVASDVPLRVGNRSYDVAGAEFLTARVDEVRVSPSAEGQGLFPRFARAQGYASEGTDNGLLTGGRALTAAKRAGSTGLRIVWSDNFRVFTTNSACRWEVLINSAPCASPGALVFDKYEGNTGSNRHDPSTFVGTCFGVPAGNVAVATRVGPTPGYTVADCATGWNGQLFSIEAEEVQ